MIILAGIRSETSCARVAGELDRADVAYRWFDQRQAADTDCVYHIDHDGLGGTLRLGAETFRLEDVVAVYTRIMDDRFLPELQGLPADAPQRTRSRALHEAFLTWIELTPARVINRAAAMASNCSKPYQAQLIQAAGFDVPTTLVTNQPDLVRDFVATHGSVIYKSVSGTRSIVKELDDDSLARLDDIGWCPVQFQAYVGGMDVRVHVVGDEVFATRAYADGTDYRYANARLEATKLSEALEQRCVELTARLGLTFSGIDLRITPDEQVVCFEVNPCPAYTYYQENTGQPIAAAVARHLVGRPVTATA
jgi:glutathione synthase/RimK-type ligase-like ATP-grasp enzyme